LTDTPDSIRVLLADRHALFRQALRTVLEGEAEIQVVAEARSGQEAISEAERTLPHVAILDVDLPMSDGSQTTAAIKANVPRCQVLVLSAREDYRSLVEVLDAGARGYIPKECRPRCWGRCSRACSVASGIRTGRSNASLA
jgi:DNA-binding NarL/FixJ family response regulator